MAGARPASPTAGRSRRAVTARREVIVAAGAIQSPQLLQLSGDRAARRLLQTIRHSGRPSRSPGVGENLQDHLQARVIFRCTKPITTNDALNSRVADAGDGRVAIRVARTGPMAVGINQGGIFAARIPR